MIEERIEALVDALNKDPATRQRGEWRVRIQGPWVGMLDPNKRWLVAAEPYNDHDLAVVWGPTLDEALVLLGTRVQASMGRGRR